MTIAAFEAQASWLPLVVGMTCSGVETDGERMLALHFGEGETERSILMDGAWRIAMNGHVLVASADPDDERLEMLTMLHAARLEAAEVERPGYDLRLLLRHADAHQDAESAEIVVRCFPIDSLQYAEAVEDPEDAEVAWWVSGNGIADDWESHAQGNDAPS